MKNKNGFTLVELLVVIAILAVLVAFAVPNFISIFNDSKSSLSEIQKSQIKEAAELYLEDYCINPIGNNTCEKSIYTGTDSNGFIIISGGNLPLSTLINKGYFSDNTLNTKCDGNILFDNDKIVLDGITCNL